MHPILFLCSDSEIKGGGQVSLLELVKRIDRSKYLPRAIVGAHGPLFDAFVKEQVSVEAMALPRIAPFPGPGAVLALRKIVRFIRSNAIQLVHSNDSRAHAYAGLACLFTKTPTLFHYRVSYKDGLFDTLLPLLCKKIIAVSNATAARFPRWFKDKTTVIYNSVDTDRFSPGEKPVPNPYAKGNGPIIGSVGRFGAEKGFALLVLAVALLRNDFPDISLTLVGSGQPHEKAALEETIRTLSMQDQVLCIDQCAAMPDFMRALDAYALLSENEGLNRSILEAMACGRSVVATRVGGTPEIITGPSMGFMVQPGDPVSAANGLKTILEDPETRKAMEINARARIIEAFTIQEQVRRMEEEFDTLLKS